MKKDHQELVISTTPPHYLTGRNRKKERSSNLELYRIIVMLLIVMHHYVINSGLIDVMAQHPTALKSIFLYLIGVWGKTGINCFVMITGYFMCQSHITLHKFLKILLQVEFYGIIIGVIFMFIGYTPVTMKGVINMINPIKSSYDFTSSFLVFYLFIPFLNVCINNLSQRQHLKLLFLSVFTFSILGSIPIIKIGVDYISWFCVLYVVASYLRKYPVIFDKSFMFWGILTIFSLIISMMSVFFILIRFSIVGYPFENDHLRYFLNICYFINDSNKILALFVSVCSFMMFKNMPLKHSKIINTVASCTFGVLLIHAASDDMRRWLWQDICNNVGIYHQNTIYLHALFVPLIVFSVCALIDYIRQKSIEQPLINGVERVLSKLRF